MKATPQIRIRNANGRPVQTEGQYVLYWMNAFRRVEWNFSLQLAIEWSNDLRKPLLVLETVFCDYPWASDRIHQFVLDGRNPNCYSGIFWVLGRYDRAWGPERPIFGKVRYMSSENTARKFPLQKYLMKYGTSRV